MLAMHVRIVVFSQSIACIVGCVDCRGIAALRHLDVRHLAGNVPYSKFESSVPKSLIHFAIPWSLIRDFLWLA